MSFPSAIERLNGGDTPEAALLFAMQHDTPLGFAALTGLAHAIRTGVCACCTVKAAIGPQHKGALLRKESRGQGVKMDFHPDSLVGKQVARLMTDAARSLLEEHMGLHFGFANCCGVITSPMKIDTQFTAAEQIAWQRSIDC